MQKGVILIPGKCVISQEMKDEGILQAKYKGSFD